MQQNVANKKIAGELEWLVQFFKNLEILIFLVAYFWRQGWGVILN